LISLGASFFCLDPAAFGRARLWTQKRKRRAKFAGDAAAG